MATSSNQRNFDSCDIELTNTDPQETNTKQEHSIEQRYQKLINSSNSSTHQEWKDFINERDEFDQNIKNIQQSIREDDSYDLHDQEKNNSWPGMVFDYVVSVLPVSLFRMCSSATRPNKALSDTKTPRYGRLE